MQHRKCLAGQYLSLAFVPSFLLVALGQNLSLVSLSCASDCGDAIHKFGLEEYVCIGEHSIFQRHHHKLQRKNGHSVSVQIQSYYSFILLMSWKTNV